MIWDSLERTEPKEMKRKEGEKKKIWQREEEESREGREGRGRGEGGGLPIWRRRLPAGRGGGGKKTGRAPSSLSFFFLLSPARGASRAPCLRSTACFCTALLLYPFHCFSSRRVRSWQSVVRRLYATLHRVVFTEAFGLVWCIAGVVRSCGVKDSWQRRLGHAIWNSVSGVRLLAWIRRFSGVVCGSLCDRALAISWPRD